MRTTSVEPVTMEAQDANRVSSIRKQGVAIFIDLGKASMEVIRADFVPLYDQYQKWQSPESNNLLLYGLQR